MTEIKNPMMKLTENEAPENKVPGKEASGNKLAENKVDDIEELTLDSLETLKSGD